MTRSTQIDWRMKQTTRSFPILLLLVAPLLLLPLGHATAIVPSSGDFTTTVTSETISQVASIVTIDEHFSLAITGTLSGITAGTATVIVNLKTGTGVFFGMQTFTGTVLTASGTVQLSFSATFVGSNFQGQFALFGGTGGLTNLHGQGSIQGIVHVSGSYSGFVIFAPS